MRISPLACAVIGTGACLFSGLLVAAELPPPTLEDIRSGTVEGLFDAPVSLDNGRWEGAPYAAGGASRPSAGIAGDLMLTGDLTGDGVEETVVFLWSATGGSGTRNHIAVFQREGNRVVNTATALIGDRVQVRGGRIEDGRIVLDLVQHGPDDAMCCPSMNATRTWSVDGDKLLVDSEKVGEPLSVKDLEGENWRLKSIAPDRDLTGTVTLMVEDGQVSGRASCNRYTATIADGDAAGEVRIGQIASTQMACVDETVTSDEREFLAALAGVDRFGFITGDLILTSFVDGRQITLRFERPQKEDN